MGKLKSGFNSSRNERKLKAIRKGQIRRTFNRNLKLDHQYASNFRTPNSTPDISNAILEEINDEDDVNITPNTDEFAGNENITVCVDAGWQKRGSGRVYDSLTGHCSMIGAKSRKILGYKWRSKTCRICEVASRKGKIPKVHQCRKSFGGSAKAMEPDLVIDLVREARLKGKNICTIVGDEDSTTIARKISNANVSAGPPPGVHKKKTVHITGLTGKEKKAIAVTKKAKLHRIQLNSKQHNILFYNSLKMQESESHIKHAESTKPQNNQTYCYDHQNTSSCEVREEGTALGLEPDITEIPAPVQMVTNQSMHPNLSRIYFDLEATGLSLSSYYQPNLFQTLLSQTYDNHRADEDVDAQYTIVHKTVVNNCHFEKVHLSNYFILEKYLSMKELQNNLPSLKLLVDNKILSISMARIIAKSGLSLQHLK
ncbi:unnamed protein product [Mytilus coruscus]|uniref:Exonuclease domain-containing protein n=1 Tax=Mytilus coruscus TaxID=42192 RepID=A0A6J8APS0_MYTCO|nr:unnamed protein product [Mytilus coruscus]